MPETGLLLMNVGTPDAPRTREVRRYLREFLGDPAVIDIPAPARWLLLNLVILPRRPKVSAAAYAKIWTDAGSPLLVYGRELVGALAQRFPERAVRLGMRYGSPAIEDALAELVGEGCERVVLVPLYPQLAASSTGTSVARARAAAARLADPPALDVLPPFHDDPGFIGAFVERGRPVLAELEPDHVLFSFHGLPERHIRRADPSGTHCLASAGCCARLTRVNRSCYRAQCFATAAAIAGRLALPDGGWTVCFQSRLGRTPWIQPFTDVVIPELARRGVERIAVFCPAFVADCLETLEEIGMRAADDFRAAGGEALRLVPSLNASPAWVDALADLIRRFDVARPFA